MKEKIVTVFGGTGFIGRSVIPRLLSQGFHVRVGTRNIAQAKRFLPTTSFPVSFVSIDMQNPSSLQSAITGSTGVINLIGILYETRQASFPSIHFQGPQLLAQFCTKHRIPFFIHISALGASEESPSRYAQTKALGEKAIYQSYPDAVILRPSVIFGPGDQFLNRFAKIALWSPALPLIGGGKTRFQPVYVEDVAQAIMNSINPQHKGKIFELGGPKIYTLQDILSWILQSLRRKRIYIPLPFFIAYWLAHILKFLPQPPLTPDQVLLLKTDNILSGQFSRLEDLAIHPTALEKGLFSLTDSIMNS